MISISYQSIREIHQRVQRTLETDTALQHQAQTTSIHAVDMRIMVDKSSGFHDIEKAIKHVSAEERLYKAGYLMSEDDLNSTPEQRQHFEDLAREHHNLLFTVAYRMMRHQESAEDVVHDALIKAWRRREELEAIENVSGWLVTICRNTALDALRRQKVRQTQSLTTSDRSESLTAPTLAVDEDQSENQQAILSAMSDLTEEQQEVIRLRFIEGMSIEDISTKLNIKAHTLSGRLYRGLQALRKNPELRQQLGMEDAA